LGSLIVIVITCFFCANTMVIAAMPALFKYMRYRKALIMCNDNELALNTILARKAQELSCEEEELHGGLGRGDGGGGDDEKGEEAEGIHGRGGVEELRSSVAVGAEVSPTDERRGGAERGWQAVTCARGVRVHCGGHEPIQYPRCHPNRDRHHGPY
jgi:hypothetical protein